MNLPQAEAEVGLQPAVAVGTSCDFPRRWATANHGNREIYRIFSPTVYANAAEELSRRLTVNANAVTTELGMYDLIAYVIMPNYVHILIQPKTVLPKTTKWIEGVCARQANSILGRTGMSFWQDESFDRWVRSAAELEKIVHYIETNPVRANLVVEPKFWRYSSAALATHRLKPVPPI